MNTITRRLRARRNHRVFTRAVATASPTMQSELLAAATRAGYRGQ